MKKVLIIAEAGVNHNGNLTIAKQMVDVAKECGADIIKFQTAKLSSLVSKTAPMAEYQKRNTGENVSQREMLKKLLLSFEQFEELACYCETVGIEFLSTPFDLESVKFLNELGVKFWKIPSGEITNLPYLEAIALTGKDVVLSTGMSTIQEISDSLEILKNNGAGKITLLHCTTEYPAPYEQVNLNSILTLKTIFGLEVGYSDHTSGIEVPIAATALGATVIEKHFTLDRTMEGPDHKASLEPKELKKMVDAIRNIEKALGDGDKRPSPMEIKNRAVARKSIVASKSIKRGDMLTIDNITTKRPGNGISPMEWYTILGMVASKDFEEDEMIII